MRTQVILIPIGSGGDVFPLIALGKELQRRGHHVAVMTNPLFRKHVGQAGLEFIELGSATGLHTAGKDQRVHQRRSSWKIALRWGALGTMRETVERLKERRKTCPTLLVGSPLAFGARLAAEAYEIPLVTIVLSPYLIRSVKNSPTIPPMWLGCRVPEKLKSLQFRIADRFFIDPVVKQQVNALQKELGLQPTDRFLHKWCFSDDLCLAAFPEPFAPRQADWPDHLRHTGNFVWDPQTESGTDAALLAFVDPEKKPVVVTAGSIGALSDTFYRHWITATQRLGRQLILLERNSRLVPRPLPAHVFHATYIPVDEVLRHASTIVHTGGVGVTLRSLAAGTPQIVLPRVNDQHDNAARIRNLGAGIVMKFRAMTAENISRNLNAVLDPEIKAACERYRAALPATHAVQTGCDLMESVFRDFVSRSDPGSALKAPAS